MVAAKVEVMMEELAAQTKPHFVCVPATAQASSDRVRSAVKMLSLLVATVSQVEPEHLR